MHLISFFLEPPVGVKDLQDLTGVTGRDQYLRRHVECFLAIGIGIGSGSARHRALASLPCPAVTRTRNP